MTKKWSQTKIGLIFCGPFRSAKFSIWRHIVGYKLVLKVKLKKFNSTNFVPPKSTKKNLKNSDVFEHWKLTLYADKKLFFWVFLCWSKITILKFNSLMNSNVGRFMLESLDLNQKSIPCSCNLTGYFLNYSIILLHYQLPPPAPNKIISSQCTVEGCYLLLLGKGTSECIKIEGNKWIKTLTFKMSENLEKKLWFPIFS